MHTLHQRRLTGTHTLIATACVLLLLLTGCADTSKEKAAKPPPPNVQVAEVTQDKVPIVMTFSGTVQSVKSVDIIPRVSGYIDARYFEEGTFVKKDAPLYLIDPRPYKARLDSHRAQLKSHQASAVFWKSEEKRYTLLAKQGAASVAAKEQAIARRRETLAEIEKSQADIENAKLELSFTNVTAPFSGRIQNTKINVGQLVRKQQEVLTTLKQIDPIYVVFNVSRRQVAHIQQLQREGLGFASWKDDKVEVELPDGSLYSQQGRLNFISAQIDPTTDTLEYRAVFPNPTDSPAQTMLIPGQYVPVHLTVGENPNAWLIPGPALVHSQVGTRVYVLNTDKKVESRHVEVGQAYKQQWLIKKGLTKGERVIYEGLQKVRPGMVVTIMDASPQKS